MTQNPIDTREIARLLSDGRVSDALDILDNAVSAHRALSPYSDPLRAEREAYRFITDFLMRGLPDPGRQAQVDDLKRSILDTADAMSRSMLAVDAPTLYFSMVRTASVTTARALADYASDYLRISQRLALAALAENPSDASRELTLRAEALEKDMFNHLWISYPYSSADDDTLASLMADPSVPAHAKGLLTGALTLGLLEWADERRLLRLMDLYEHGQDAVSVRALCGLLLGLWRWRDRQLSPRLKTRLDALRDLPGWTSDVRMATMQFVRARDTERITRKFNDEILPDMMRLRPEIDKLGSMPANPEELTPEGNPEWAEMLEKSGMADRLRELQDLQDEGGDVMMATFSRLKTFPFFHDVANWFLPFHDSHSSLAGVPAPLVGMLGTIGGPNPFCDSDLYSLVLSMSQVPEEQRQMLQQQMSAYSDQMAQMQAAGTGLSLTREALTSQYVRDIYRFYKLFRRKVEFNDPFASGLNLPALPVLADIFDDPDTLRLIGEFYFSRRYYADAYSIFERLDRLSAPDASLFQKMGYCRQALGDMQGALLYYEQSEMLNSRSRWTRSRLAHCHLTLGHWREALRYYRELADDKPDHVATLLHIYRCLFELGEYAEAMQVLFKAEYLEPGSRQVTRLLAWCTLMQADYTRCADYSKRVLSADPADIAPEDYLVAGHLALLTGEPRESVGLYRRSVAVSDADSFRKAFARHRSAIPGLAAADPLTLDIIADMSIHSS